MNAIQIKNITKRYKDVTALDDISFSFEFGRIYGFLGRNGAGKSTLINIIANRIFADQGEVLIDGIPAKENMGVHEKIFCMSEADLYDRDLKVKDHFKWTNRFYNDFDLDKAFELSKKFNLDINKRFKALSKGYQSIFKLIIALSLNVPYVCAFLVAAVLAGVYLLPEEKTVINEIVMTWLPYFVFIMYAINRGTNFTQALFMNCDHSLLTYSFYKQPSFILRLFQIRLREIMKINAVPALVIGIGLALILFATGGTDNPLNYVVLVVSILCMSLFFSIHYLTIYYLLQPYNAGTELKSGTYRIVLSVTYVVCFALMRLRMPIMIFGIMTIVFCVLYSIVASILVYRLAPKTFRLRT